MTDQPLKRVRKNSDEPDDRPFKTRCGSRDVHARNDPSVVIEVHEYDGRQDDALQLVQETFEAARRHSSLRDQVLVPWIKWIIRVYARNGRHEEAHQLVRDTFEAYLKDCSLSAPEFAPWIKRMVILYERNGQPGEARQLVQDTFQAYRLRRYSLNCSAVAPWIKRMIRIYKDGNRQAEARQLAQDTFNAYRQRYGLIAVEFEVWIARMIGYQNHEPQYIGDPCNDCCQHGSCIARVFFPSVIKRETFEVYRKQYGLTHPLFAPWIDGMINVYEKDGRRDLAHQLVWDTFKSYRDLPGLNGSVFPRGVKSSISWTHDNLQRIQDVFETCRQQYGLNHCLFAPWIESMVEILESYERYDEARQLVQDTYQAYRQKYSLSDPKIEPWINLMLQLHDDMRELVQATFEAYRDRYGLNHRLVLPWIEEMFIVYAEDDQQDDARQLLQDVVETCRQRGLRDAEPMVQLDEDEGRHDDARQPARDTFEASQKPLLFVSWIESMIKNYEKDSRPDNARKVVRDAFEAWAPPKMSSESKDGESRATSPKTAPRSHISA